MKKFITVLCSLVAHISYSQSTTFDTSGVWTCPSGVTSVMVECWGGGGGGGYAATIPGSTSIAAGGGGGCYSKKMIPVTAGMTYTVHVGMGGAGGNATTIDGQAGGDSWFGSVTDVIAKGSGGGSGNNAPPAISGGSGNIPGSVGDTTFMGGNGHPGEISSGRFSTSYYSGGGGSSAEATGNGADGDMNNPGIATASGGNGGNGVSNTSGAGTNGSVPGGGGGGSMVLDNGTTMSFNGGKGGSGRVVITPLTPLPIELLYFTASYIDTRNILFKWKVAGRNARNITYSIEACRDGAQFTEIYREKYTGQIPPEYSYRYGADNAAAYYRLKSTDEHGTVKYSPIAGLTNDRGNTAVSFYPNPSGNISFIDYNAPVKDNISIAVSDIKGRKVLSVYYAAEEGNNRLALDIASLQKGIYVAEMFDGKGKPLFTSRLVKQ